jgi:hypothetical protein
MKRLNYTLSVISLALLLWQPLAHAEGEADFLLFVSADDLERSSVSEPAVQSSDFTPTVDFLFSYNNGPWRVLAEHFLTDDENELERLQVGYNLSKDNTIWLGRFHQPISAWNHQYHHGAYLQPSISRPSIENWEDDDGLLPAHITGVMVDAWQPLGANQGIRYAASLGIAPTLAQDELLPFDILDPGDSSGEIAGSINIAYYPDYVGESNFGLIGGYADIEAAPNVALGIATDFFIEQKLLGAQVNWLQGDWHFLSAAYYVDNKIENTSINVGGWFLSAYAQALRSTSRNTDAYVRFEHTSNATKSGYLRMFPFYVYRRELAGFRWDFAEHQALALEISNNKVVTDTYTEIRLQWSAVLP